jgi:aspartate/methionine/tyrosine aminotransferase
MRLNPQDALRAVDSPIGLAHDALDLRAGAHELLDLAQAAPQYPPAPEVVERIVATAQHPHSGEYTEIAGLPRLREALQQIWLSLSLACAASILADGATVATVAVVF